MSWFRVLVTCLTVGALVACADAESIVPPPPAPPVGHTVSFVGYVYDGATGARLDGYTLDLLIADGTVAGAVDGEGRFLAGPLSVWDDFTVVIGGDGYRAFRSHNARVGLPPELAQSDDIAEIATHQTLHFDAYLFPSSLQAPAVTFSITTPTGTAPSGTLRLRPVSKSLLEDSADETPSGVPGQLWENDEDLQSQTLSRSFSDGQLALNAGDLVYGVTYQVSIFDVQGFQPFEGTYTAGVETNKTFQLEEELAEPLVVVSSSANACTPPAQPTAMSGAIITIELNHNIEEASTGYPGGAAEALDDGLVISSPDLDGDLVENLLKPDLSNAVQERAVSLDITGDTLTISWNPSLGLESPIDPDDPIVSVTYTGLGNVQIQRAGSPSSAVALSTLLGVSSLTCPP